MINRLFTLLTCLFLVAGCANPSLLKGDKLITENVIEVDFVSNTKHIQIELDEETQEKLITAFNNIPKKQEYLLDDGGAFAWMNHFDFESIDEEIIISYLPLHSAISYNNQKYVIPLDCEFYNIVF